jgi:CrcB protein
VKTFLSICAAGAAGTGARYLVNVAASRWIGAAFPFGTLAVNLVGSCLLGVVMELALRGFLSPEARAVLATGVMGGFTTYSSFNYELLSGVQRGAWAWSAGYLVATVVGCLASGAAGIWLARAAVAG